MAGRILAHSRMVSLSWTLSFLPAPSDPCREGESGVVTRAARLYIGIENCDNKGLYRGVENRGSKEAKVSTEGEKTVGAKMQMSLHMGRKQREHLGKCLYIKVRNNGNTKANFFTLDKTVGAPT